MARPTRAQLRRLLQDWGLPQVDPDSFFIGVFPESISIAVDEIERLTAQDRGWINTKRAIKTVTANATSATNDVNPAPGPNEVIIIRNLVLDLVTANIERVEIILRGDSGQLIIWQEGVTGGPAFPAGRLIGTGNIETTSFGTNLPIVLDGRDNQILTLTIRKAVGALITADIGIRQQTFVRPFVGFAT